MTEEHVEQGQPEAAAQDQSTGVPKPSPTPPQEVETPDAPQSIPYVRFKEVNDRAKAAEDHAKQLEARVQSLEVKPTTEPATQRLPTRQEILAAYEHGQITEEQKDQWRDYYNKEEAKQEFRTEVLQGVSLMKAKATIEEYAKAMPALRDPSSQEFTDFSAAYYELIQEGAPGTGPMASLTQSRALKIAFGRLKPAASHAAEQARQRADTFLEGAGGGKMTTHNEPLQDVPERQQQHWKKQGYTKARMIDEAKFRDVKSIEDYRRLVARAK